MTAKYEAFARFFFELIRREAAARETRDIMGNRRSYNVKTNTFEKLHRLASEVIADTENAADVSEIQREAVAFVFNLNPVTFGNFLSNLNGRYMVATRFYPQCIEEYTYKRRDWLPVAQWAAEAFGSEETTEETTETAEPAEAIGETTEETTETKDAPAETVDETTETEPEPTPSTLSIFVRFASDYSAAVNWELNARRAGTHSTIDAAAFGELHRLARSIVQDRETFHGLTVRQQTITAAVDSIASADAFNALHTKAAADALERFAADIAPTAAQLDEWTAPEDSTKIEERRADLPEPAPLSDAIPEPIAEGSDRWAKYDDIELNGATVDYVARRLFDVLPPRPSVGVLTIPRRGDEPLEVPAEPLRRLDYRDRLQRIAEAANVSPEVAVKMIYMAPWIGYEEEPEPETVDEVKPAEVDEGKDEGAPELVGVEAAPTSGGLTWNDILSIDWSFYD